MILGDYLPKDSKFLSFFRTFFGIFSKSHKVSSVIEVLGYDGEENTASNHKEEGMSQRETGLSKENNTYDIDVQQCT